MDIGRFEKPSQQHILKRCRDHLAVKGKMRGVPLTFDYRYEHTRTVAAIAVCLANELGVDPHLASIAAWLHDLAKCWDPGLDEATNRRRAADHGAVGAEEAALFLAGLGCPEEATRRICQAVANHVGYLKDYTLEDPLDALLWDADKLSKIGVAGSLHFLGARLTIKNNFTDIQEYFAQPDAKLHQGIRGSLNTGAARQMADAMLAEAAAFRRQILRSLAGGC